MVRRDYAYRRGKVPPPWITRRGDLDCFSGGIENIVRAAGLRDELSFTYFHQGGFTGCADADMTEAEVRAAGRLRSACQSPTYAKRTRKQLISVAVKGVPKEQGRSSMLVAEGHE